MQGLGVPEIDGTMHDTNPSSVRERAFFCSELRLVKALRAVVRAGDCASADGASTIGVSSSAANK